MPQQLLQFDRKTMAPETLVVLGADDLRYHERCIKTDAEFTWGFLVMTRAQRIGATPQCLESMLAYERNLELAEEALVMRSPDWATCRPATIDWVKIDRIGKNAADIRWRAFEAFRESWMLTKMEYAHKNGVFGSGT